MADVIHIMTTDVQWYDNVMLPLSVIGITAFWIVYAIAATCHIMSSHHTFLWTITDYGDMTLLHNWTLIVITINNGIRHLPWQDYDILMLVLRSRVTYYSLFSSGGKQLERVWEAESRPGPNKHPGIAVLGSLVCVWAQEYQSSSP